MDTKDIGTEADKILKKETIPVSFDKWSNEVQNNIKEVEKIFWQNIRKDIMQLKTQRKKLRARYQNTENIYETTAIIERIKLIKEHITDKMKENRSRRIIKIWEIKQKFQRKNETPHTIKDEKNNRIESSSQILEEYKKYYENLLKARQSETAEETQIQFKVEKEFQQITNRQGDKKERITETIIRKAIRKMKNKKAADRLGWKAEWIKEGGEEMVKSLYILFNRIKTENQIPKQWQLTTVKSIHKGGVKENIQENQRGIFLVNTVSKIYESALKIQNENKNENMSQMQTAGRKQRSAVDNLIILNSIIENQRQYKNKTYIFFADAKKCFDKLWLKDCLIEMYNLGYSPGTIRSLYEINKTSNIVVDTPVGKTSSITVEEVVKQGTTFGPIMCCASTSRVNEIQEAVKYQYGKVEIGMPVLMDDIAAVGTGDNVRKRIENRRKMEIEKKMIY